MVILEKYISKVRKKKSIETFISKIINLFSKNLFRSKIIRLYFTIYIIYNIELKSTSGDVLWCNLLVLWWVMVTLEPRRSPSLTICFIMNFQLTPCTENNKSSSLDLIFSCLTQLFFLMKVSKLYLQLTQ